MIKELMLLAAGATQMPSAPADSLSDLLKAKTEAFSEAGQAGDGKTMAALLDDNVVFVNEGGDMPTKREIVESAQPPQPGVKRKIEVTDWHLTPHGSTAVARFVDVVTQQVGNQKTIYKFLSTEVWEKKNGDWLMISSQTLALQQDPAAVKLTSAMLDQYVGNYALSPQMVFHITRDGDKLMGGMNDAAPTEMKAEAPDVLFSPGNPRLRRVFQRDAQGRVTGFASRREGIDLFLTRLG